GPQPLALAKAEPAADPVLQRPPCLALAHDAEDRLEVRPKRAISLAALTPLRHLLEVEPVVLAHAVQTKNPRAGGKGENYLIHRQAGTASWIPARAAVFTLPAPGCGSGVWRRRWPRATGGPGSLGARARSLARRRRPWSRCSPPRAGRVAPRRAVLDR